MGFLRHIDRVRRRNFMVGRQDPNRADRRLITQSRHRILGVVLDHDCN